MKMDLDKFLELNVDELIAVNGGGSGTCSGSSWAGDCDYYSDSTGGSGGSSSGSCSGSSSGASRTAGTCGGSTVGTCSGSSSGASGTASTCGGSTGTTTTETASSVTETTQRSFSAIYGSEFGNHACAATSLLNEISEEYTAITGKSMTESQAEQAMAAAVQSGSVNKTDAYVSDWSSAANSLAESLGLSGTYTYTTNASGADAVIYAIDKNNDGVTDHFVNSCGNGSYYDSWTGTTGSVSDLYAKGYTITTRYLDYNK